MPVLIEEVIAEVSDTVTQPEESAAPSQQVPMSVAENELTQSLALIQQRQDRLKID